MGLSSTLIYTSELILCSITSLPTLGICFKFSRSWNRLHAPASRFPSLGNDITCSTHVTSLFLQLACEQVHLRVARARAKRSGGKESRFNFAPRALVLQFSRALAIGNAFWLIYLWRWHEMFSRTIILKSLSNVNRFNTMLLEIFSVNNKFVGTITWWRKTKQHENFAVKVSVPKRS